MAASMEKTSILLSNTMHALSRVLQQLGTTCALGVEELSHRWHDVIIHGVDLWSALETFHSVSVQHMHPTDPWWKRQIIMVVCKPMFTLGLVLLGTVSLAYFILRVWRRLLSQPWNSSKERRGSATGSITSSQHRPRARADSQASVNELIEAFDHHSILTATTNTTPSKARSPFEEDESSQGDDHDDYPNLLSEAQQNRAMFEVGTIVKLMRQRHRRLPVAVTKRFAPKGRLVQTLNYHTLCPPLSWAEASRKLVPKDRGWSIYQTITIDLKSPPPRVWLGEQELNGDYGSSSNRKNSDSQRMNHPDGSNNKNLWIEANHVGTHVQRPVEGGVLHIYVKDAPQDQWREHTFPSSSKAAQFQLDLLATQLFGPQIFNMYHALELVHRGSLAYLGREVVLHDAALSNSSQQINTQPTGVPWDDVMRCLGSHSVSIRLRLEALWWVHKYSAKPVKLDEGNNSDPSSRFQNEEYAEKRILLGLVDFFRLFVPRLPEAAVPDTGNNQKRMEKLLRTRRRIARSAALVQLYLEARRVSNVGWNLRTPIPTNKEYLVRRLSYDTNSDNVRRDAQSRNEFYEATVSRDVVCQVRDKHNFHKTIEWWELGLWDSTVPSVSGYQGYTLVGMHCFQWEPQGADFPLQPNKDPVESIPSLGSLMERNPERDFFVQSHYAEDGGFVVIQVFVRALPEGFDPIFDASVERFTRGTAQERRRKLECVMQLGIGKEGLSRFAHFVLHMLSLLMRLYLRGSRTHTSKAASANGRTTIPAINLAACGETYHFGGALQRNPRLPTNYVASSTHISSRRRNNSMLTRLLLCYLKVGDLSRDVTDFTYLFAGTRRDEVPERAVASIRIVSANFEKCALPIDFITGNNALLQKYPPRDKEDGTGFILLSLFAILLVDPIIVFLNELFRKPRASSSSSPVSDSADKVTSKIHRGNRYVASSAKMDQFEHGVNELVESLGAVSVPLQTPSTPSVVSSDDIDDDEPTYTEVPILQVVSREDIKRFLIAADGDMAEAAARTVKSVTWRSLVFPINTRFCRVELQSGQFFRQGRDLDGHPLFYFRCVCLGPWRQNEEATISAVLHRLEKTLEGESSSTKCTLIVLAGNKRKRTSESRKTARDDESTFSDEGSTVVTQSSRMIELSTYNPRVHQQAKSWSTHCNKRLLSRLVETLLTHYPERLHRALVVVGHDKRSVLKSIMSGKLALARMLGSSRTKDKVHFLRRHRDLHQYVSRDTLVTLAGGSAAITPEAFRAS